MATTAEITRFLQAILGFESGGDPTIQNRLSSAGGLFGYIDSTWAGYGGYAHARDAPASVQWAKARADVANKLARYNGDWRLVAMSWYLPAAVTNPALRDEVPAEYAGNTKTPNEYADLVMAKFTGRATNTTSGATSGTGRAVASTAPKSQAELLDYIAENYPDVYGLLSVNAEVRSVILTAAKNGYTATRLRAELAKTSWWRKTANVTREWDASYALDKATGDQLLRQTQQEIRAQAARLGVPLDSKALATMALNVRRLGWTPQAVQEALAARFRQRTAKAGLGTAAVDQIRALASDYGITMSDREVTGWVQRMLAGQADETAVRSMLVKRAKVLYRTIADEIDEGVTVRDYFDPYAQRAAQLLGLNPGEIDFTDEKWGRAIARVDPATGKRAPMDFDQWATELRTNPLYGYDRTQRGRAEAASFADQFAKAVGY